MRRAFWVRVCLGLMGLSRLILPAYAAGVERPSAPAISLGSSLAQQASILLKEKSYLPLRVLIKNAYSKSMTYGDWYSVLGIVNSNADKLGFDLVWLWNARNPQGKSNFDKTLEYGDSLMLANNFGAAFSEYQKMADYLRKQIASLSGNQQPGSQRQLQRFQALYPFVLHSMARSLYGSGRYVDALLVYRWISPSYVWFRQVLFERMWAAFRAGQVEEALGAIASQRSVYFSRFLSPEAYLIESYIYRKLCRTSDLDRVIQEVKAYEGALSRNEGMAEWAGNELEVRVLWNLANQGARVPKGVSVSESEIVREKNLIQSHLNRTFLNQKPRVLQELRTVLAYAHLAEVTDTRTVLKPIEKLTSRDQLLKRDLEIWPVDQGKRWPEEWADEVGNRFFIGDSQCPSSAR